MEPERSPLVSIAPEPSKGLTTARRQLENLIERIDALVLQLGRDPGALARADPAHVAVMLLAESELLDDVVMQLLDDDEPPRTAFSGQPTLPM